MAASIRIKVLLWGTLGASFLFSSLVLFAEGTPGPEEPASAVPGPEGTGLRIHSLKEFGPTSTRVEAEATYRKALEALTTENGGLLVVPEDVAKDANLENVARWSHSVDPPSCRLRDWKVGPGVLVFDNRGGTPTLRVPQVGERNNAGLTLERTLRLPQGDSLTHWTEESVLNIQNNVVHGPCNYMEWINEPVKAGKDARFYVPTVRNIFKGMFLNAHHGPGYRAPVARITVKDIGWDPEKKLYYFTADTNTDHTKAAIVQNKSHVPAVKIVNNLNAANQTFDFYLRRNQYANGDSYLFDARFHYMGNVHSMPGDENGTCYMAEMRPMLNIFDGRVQSYDGANYRLVFKAGRNANTLANTRPLINLNEKKWIAQGKIVIVPPNNPIAPYEEDDEGRWKYQGKSYPSYVGPGPVTGHPELHVGGLIRGDRDCPWDDSLIGRFFAVDEPTEYVTGREAKPKLRRWYEIASVKVNPDGTKDLQIKRYWWGAKAWDSPTLYNPENYTRDGRVRPLSYVIAPGAYVNNVSEAVGAPHQHQGKAPFAVGVSPSPVSGSGLDFEPDDPIEQALGADPFKPQGLRIWAFDAVQGAWPSSMIDLASFGAVARSEGIKLHGGPRKLEDCENRKERRPAWDSAIRIDSAANVGLDCNADFADAAIKFRQPYSEQTIKWLYARSEGQVPKEATLGVNKETGDFNLRGGNLRLDGSVVAKGLSADETPARNLRGKNVPVEKGKTKVEVTFPVREPDGDYAVFVEQSWLTNRAITKQTEDGFTVAFAEKAPGDAKLHWMIIR